MLPERTLSGLNLIGGKLGDLTQKHCRLELAIFLGLSGGCMTLQVIARSRIQMVAPRERPTGAARHD